MKIKLNNLLLVFGLVSAYTSTNAQVNPKEKLAAVIQSIHDNYVDSISDEVLVNAAIQGMLSKLDPHSHYMGKKESLDRTQAMSGSFYGIGVVFILQNDSVYISEVIDEGPAMKAGIKSGDKIIAINGEKIAPSSLGHAGVMGKIRGEKGSKLLLEIDRPSNKTPLKIEVIRGVIPDNSVKVAFMVNEDTGYIGLKIFNSKTRNDVDDAIKALQEKGMKSLILDLQGNGGGYVESAFGIADEFLLRDQLVFYTKGHGNSEDYYYAAGTGRFPKGKLVVLIDESTASASEILSGALQDWDRAVLVGRRSFGKGLMQKPVALFDGSVMELTGARYYTPSGRSIQKPYNGDKYKEMAGDRFASGELFNSHLIQFPDSLKKSTLKNQRTVYGGGGIMPDEYVILDSITYGKWFNEFGRSGLLDLATFEYVNRNRENLKIAYPTFQQFLNQYQAPEVQIKELLTKASKKGLILNSKDQKKYKSLIATEFKAQVAAQLFGNKEYLQMVIRSNNVFQQGLSIISSDSKYQSYLNKKEVTTSNNNTTSK